MAQKNASEVSGKKIQTKYDRKMAARKEKEARDLRSDRLFKFTSAAVAAAIVLGIAAGIIFTVVRNQQAVNGTYIKLGNEDISQMEFDYYYNASVSSYMSTYSSLLPYMGYDSSKSMEEQMFSEDMTWKDMFDDMAVQQITQVRALLNDAAEKGYAADVEATLQERMNSIREAASESGKSVDNYVKTIFGPYASEKRIKPIIKNGLIASDYYNHLNEQNAPSAEEITDYYNEHQADYDVADYHSFAFKPEQEGDISEEEFAKEMENLKTRAENFKKAREGGADFLQLCRENAFGEDKTAYENADGDISLNTGMYKNYTVAALRDWVFDDARKAGDIEVIEDEENEQYYVVEFESRYYGGETSDSQISEEITGERVMDYVDEIMKKYPVSDPGKHLKYLK